MVSIGAATKKHGAKGFTLVEVLITMLLLSVMLIGLAALQIQAIRQVTYNRQATEATRLAQSVIERYKLLPSTALSSTGGTWLPEIYRSIQMTNVGADGQSAGPFTVEYLIEEAVDHFLISVRVTWNDLSQGNTMANVSLTTARSRL